MNTNLSKFISAVLHPVLMPSYALLLIFRQSTYFSYTVSAAEKIILFIIIILTTFLFPLLLSYFMLRRGMLGSLEMEKREERMLPYLANLILLLFASYLIYRIRLPRVFFLLTLGGAASVAATLMVNMKWKISIHMVAIGALIGTFFGLSSFLLVDLRMPILIWIIIAGLLGSARLQSGSHSPAQIYSGFIVGFFCEYLLLSI